jgi:mannose-6-phosphate isomerase
VRPLLLASNQPPRFYKGGPAIARFRGEQPTRDDVPEDWVGSSTTLFGEDHAGLTVLEDGRTLRDALAADPEAYLGPARAARHGGDPGLLVKLLDAGERLPVHLHPDREFSRRHLDCPYGKTEAWVIVEVSGAEPSVHLGFQRDVDPEELRGWVVEQDVAAMLGSLHTLRVDPGDAVLVPAGVPHAIGAGVFLVELQEPTDLSVLLEWEGFAVDGTRDGHLGLGFDVALGCVDRSGFGREALERLRRRRAEAAEQRPGVRSLFIPQADPFFRAEGIRPAPVARLEPAFAILVVLSGVGRLKTASGDVLELRGGQTLLVPYAAGECTIEGELDVVRCLAADLDEER